MFSNSKAIEEHIVLGTDTKHLSHFVHILKHIKSKNISLSSRWFKKTSKHRDSCSFTGSIMTKKCKYLTRIHSHASVINSNFSSTASPTLKSFLETSNFHRFHSLERGWNGFEILLFNKLFVMLFFSENSRLLFLLINLLLLEPLTREENRSRETNISRSNLITVVSKSSPNEYINEKHHQSLDETEILVRYMCLRESQSSALVFRVE